MYRFNTVDKPVRLGVIIEALELRFRKPNNWLVLSILVGLVGGMALAFPSMGAMIVLHAQYGKVPNNSREVHLILLAFSPLTGCGNALFWVLEMEILRHALKQISLKPLTNALDFAYIRRFWSFLLPAIVAQALYQLSFWVLQGVVSSLVVTWVLMTVEILVGIPFAFVLVLLIERNLSVKEAAFESIKVVKEHPAMYLLVLFLANMGLHGGLLALRFWEPAGPYISVIAGFLLFPYPFIVTALLYRDRFPEPESPPILLTQG